MAQQLFNTKPYFDDFDPTKNFYKVLFKPGYAVQARELNQLQSILQHQITGISNHLFKKNTVIIPGGVALNNSADILSIVGLGDPHGLVGKTITNATNFDIDDDSTLNGFITAIVLGAKDPTETQPAALYIKYVRGQSDGRGTFNLSEQLRTVDSTIVTFNVDTTIGSTIGRVATVSKGVFYTRELFVDCPSQSVIIEIDKQVVSNCTVGLNVVETIITSDQDETLLDNASGSPNQYAPGADRYKVDLQLTSRNTYSEVLDDKFITLMVIENNVVTYINNRTEYAELMKTLARRTYDANGNFIVNGLNIACNESADDAYVWAHVGRGKCYLGGYEYEQIVTRSLAIDKPRDAAHQQEVTGIRRFADELPHLTVAGGPWLTELPERFSLVELLDAEPNAPGVGVIGYALYRDIQYIFGGINSQDVYRMFFDSMTLNPGKTLNDIGGIKSITAGAGQGAAVLHELRLVNINGTFNVGNTIRAATTDNQEGRLYTFLNNAAFLIKNDPAKEIPAVDIIKDTISDATAQRLVTYITNYTPEMRPLIEVDASPILTLRNGEVNYTTLVKQVFTLIQGSNSSDTLTSKTYEPYSYNNYVAYDSTNDPTPGGLGVAEEFVDLTGLITVSDSSYTIELPPSHPLIGHTVEVYATVRNTNVAAATGSLQSTTINIRTPSKSWMALGHTDVTTVDRIVEGRVIDVTNVSHDGLIATITTAENHGLFVADVVVLADIESTANPTAAFESGFNRIFNVVEVTSPTEFTVNYVATADGYNSGGQVKLPADIDNDDDRDITNRYIIDRNQDSILVQTGLIKLRRGATAPVGQIAVRYSRRSYGTSDESYVSVDSYGDYTLGDLSYIGNINDLVDSKQKVTHLRNYLDFRTRTSVYFFKNIGIVPSTNTASIILRDLNLSVFKTELINKYVVGPGFASGAVITNVGFDPTTGNTVLSLSASAVGFQQGTYYIGLNTADLSIADKSNTGLAKTFLYPKYGTRIEYDYIKFTPKHVMVFINRQEDKLTLEYKEVASLEEVLKVRRDMYKLPLMYLYMKPYTVSMEDVAIIRFENPVYQMLDIHALREKIDRNEYYASLALNRDISQEIIDAQMEIGTATVKRGFWNENLVDMSRQAYNSDDFSCTIYDRTYVAPGTVTRTVPMVLDPLINTTTWTQKGFSVMLPYTEQVAYSNNQASKFNNLNPFNMINWTSGKLILSPHVDNWVDMTVEPAAPIVNNITNITNNTTNNVTNTTVSVTNNITNTITATGTIGAITVSSANTTTAAGLGNVVTMPIVQTDTATIAPAPAIDEVVIQINNLRTSWGPDSAGGRHAITFDWVTNLGRTGRVNTDSHLSQVVGNLGANGYNGVVANSMINRLYNDTDVRTYLFAGTHFDQRPPSDW